MDTDITPVENYWESFFVSTAILPKRAEIKPERIGDNETEVKIHVRDTYKYGIKAGYAKKYEKTFQ